MKYEVEYSAVKMILECTVQFLYGAVQLSALQCCGGNTRVHRILLHTVQCSVQGTVPVYLTVHCEVQYSLLEGKSGPVSRFVQRSVYSVMCIVCCAQCEALYVQCDMCSAVVMFRIQYIVFSI